MATTTLLVALCYPIQARLLAFRATRCYTKRLWRRRSRPRGGEYGQPELIVTHDRNISLLKEAGLPSANTKIVDIKSLTKNYNKSLSLYYQNIYLSVYRNNFDEFSNGNY